jgi:hypothetical protein
MLNAIFMRVSGKMIKHMAMESIYIWMAQPTKDNGKTISSMARE